MRWVAVFVEAAVPDKDGVSLESRAVRTKISRQRFATDLLLALDHKAQVDRRPAGREEVLNSLHGGHVVAFVVGCATREQQPVANLRLERWRLPFIHGIGRLHVVVAVDREVGLSGPAVPVGDDDREAAFHHVHDLGLHAESLEAIAQPFRVAQTVLAAFRQRADRGDAQLFEEVLQVSVACGCGLRESAFLHRVSCRHRRP